MEIQTDIIVILPIIVGVSALALYIASQSGSELAQGVRARVVGMFRKKSEDKPCQ